MKQFDEKKVCFIICANNRQYLEECILYISLLKIPKGYETEVLTVEGALSMASGYNEAMNASDAKYKIYLHQDTFITEQNFIEKIIRIFCQDEKIGIIGMVGAPQLSKDGVMWHRERCGNLYRLDEVNKEFMTGIEKVKKGWKEVEVVDGLLMATQYDIPWREDILKEWDFYDVSQCLEFRRKGYKIAVPAQKKNWTIHACGAPSFWKYEKNRRIVMEAYPEIDLGLETMRIAMVHSTMISLMGLCQGFLALGHEVAVLPGKVVLNAFREEEKEAMEEWLEEGHYDLVVTYDFCPSISEACKNQEVRYLAWVYDSPLLELYTKQAKNSCNYIAVFDRKQYERLQSMEIPYLQYVPLATEVEIFGNVVVTKKDEKKYKTDVSFVGRLYAKKGFEELFGPDDDIYLQEAMSIAEGTNCVWNGNTTIFDKASQELITFATDKEPEEVWKFYSGIDKRYYFESIKLSRKCNELERISILNHIAERHQVVLYTEDTEIDTLPRVTIRPWVDYWAEMPKVFYVSKINLNITSRSIESGIPQRVFDIMAVGGFVLTNYQPELEEYFEIGVDLEVYHNLQELDEKIEYYLAHEEQRTRIAINGYKKVRAQHTYTVRLKKILEEIQSLPSGK